MTMVGKTIAQIISPAQVKTALPHIEPHEVTNPDGDFYINKSLYVDKDDGLVYTTSSADVAFVCTDGSVYYISTCGCCGGAEEPEEAHSIV